MAQAATWSLVPAAMKSLFSVKSIRFLIVVSVLLTGSVSANTQTFSSHKLEAVKKQWQGKNWLMLLWSVDCPPCFKELAVVQKLRNAHSELAVLLVNVDDFDELDAERDEVIASFSLQEMPNLYFAEGEAAKNRYIIDPAWGGELPRSYFVDTTGRFRGRSGLVSEAMLTQWLVP